MYVAKMCGICIVLHTKCGVTRSYLVFYYPCCGDMDIDQLETYGYWLKLDRGLCEGSFLAR